MASRKEIRFHKKCLKVSTANQDPKGIAVNSSRLGDAYLTADKYKKAIECFEKSLEIFQEIGLLAGIARSNGKLGDACVRVGQYKRAIQHSRQALELNSKLGDRSEIANNNHNLGNAYLSLGEYQKAFEYCEKALQISTEIGDRSGIASNNNSLGVAYRKLGEYHKAIEYFQKSLQISTKIGDRSGIASNNNNLGITYRNLGEYHKAIEYCEKALQINTEIGDRSGIASSNGSLGNAYHNLGECHKAIEYYEKGLQISTEIGDRSGIASDNGNLGIAYLSLAKYQKAIEYHEKGLQISTEIGDWSGIANNNGNLGNAYRNLGEYHKAIEYSKKGLQISTKIGDRSGIASNNGNLGLTYFRLGQYDFGESYLVKSIGLFDEIFFNFVPDKNKLEFTQQYFQVHLMLMMCFLSVERIESALFVCDLGRAKELHFCIQKQDNTVQEDMFGYAREMWDLINAGEEQVQLLKEFHEIVAEGKSDTSILNFAFDVDGFLNVWVLHDQVFFRKIEGHSGETILSLIQRLLRRRNVIIAPNSAFCNATTYATSKMANRGSGPPNENASENSASWLINLTDREILQKLFQNLLRSAVGLCKGKKLIVVPDRSLFFTPFSALIDENGRCLSDRYSIQITPSLHTLKCSMEQSRNAKLGFALFVGNPAVGTVSLNGEEVSIADLPNAADEAKCLSKIFGASPLLGREARKDVVLQLIGGASLIHIAAHGEPARGEIILAPNSSPGEPCSSVPKPESYLLTQEDIMNVSVKARLVVLCCCDTGKGKISSEGVIGITRAFMAAGARSVLATLWPIDDPATKEFMEKFYKELCQETSVCEALKRTKNFFQLHEKEHYRSFTIWAPFTIYGEDVKFEKKEIEEIRERSDKMFRDFVVFP